MDLATLIEIPRTSATGSLNIPKFSSSKVEMKNNYYVVSYNETFNHFVVKILPYKESDQIIRFEKSPPVLMEGVVVVDKKMYRVTLKDLERRIIRKSREIKKEVIDATNAIKSTRVGTIPGSISESFIVDGIGTDALQHTDEQGTERKTDLEILTDADIAWSTQVESLLNFISEKEGEDWEITETA